MIVLVTLGVLGLICCGACGVCSYFGGNAVVSAALMGVTLNRVQTDPQVIDKFGQPLAPGLPSTSNATLEEGKTSTIEFDLSGPKGKGKVYAELKNTPNGPEPTVIRVTAPDGSTINVGTTVDPTDLTFPDLDVESEMGSETESDGDTDTDGTE